MIAALLQGIVNLIQPEVAIYLFVATVIATVLGLLPAIGGEVGAVLFLPFIFGLDPVVVLPALLAIEAVTYTGASITAIVIGIPGAMGSAATVIDGFRMSQKGEGARAIGAAITSSTFGGIVTVPMALIMIPLVLIFVMQMRAPEMFFMILVGLAFLAVLSRGSMIKGLISGGIGLLLAFVGFQSLTGVSRLTFGTAYLYEGIGMVDVMLGLFAVPLVLELAASGKTIAPLTTPVGTTRDVVQGARDVLRHWGLWLRSSVIGYIVGIIPGMGANAATFVAYGQAKQTSKDPDKFGTGCVEGVIAPESANNAKEAGALLTTLALGIPGSGMMAVMLAGFILVGITPGPRMLVEHTDLCFTMLLSLVAANIMAGIMCFFGARHIVKITRVSPVYIFCLIIPVVFIGAFIRYGMLLDIIVVLIVSVLGVCFRKFGYSTPAAILGFILGGLLEYYFWHSLQAFGGLFFLTPISLVLIFILIAILGQNSIRSLFQRWLTQRTRRSHEHKT